MSTDHRVALAGRGKAPDNPLVWELATIMTVTTDTHTGSGRTETDLDLPQRRDDLTGHPLIPASTITGALARYLTRRLGGYQAHTPGTDPQAPWTRAWTALFGNTTSQAQLTPSPLILEPPAAEHPGTRRRRHNRVDPATGTIAKDALWDRETITVGSRGLLRLTVRIRHRDLERDMLVLLLAACAGFNPTDPDPLRIGTRTVTGNGALTPGTWVAHRYDLATADGLTGYHDHPWATQNEHYADQATRATTDLHTAVRQAIPPHQATPPDQPQAITRTRFSKGPAVPDLRQVDRFEVTVQIAVPDPGRHKDLAAAGHSDPARAGSGPIPAAIRVGDRPPAEFADLDLAHATRPAWQRGATVDEPVLGAGASRNWLRRSATAVAATINPATGPDLVATWFGDARPRKTPTASRVLSSDPPLTGGGWVNTTRIALDPIFGDPVPGALFTERVHAGGTATWTITVRDPDPVIRGLIIQALWDGHTWCPHPYGGGGAGRITVTTATLHQHTPQADDTTRQTGTDLFAPGAAAADVVRQARCALFDRLRDRQAQG